MRRERLGLTLVAAALMVVAITTGALLRSQRAQRLEQARVAGQTTARLLSRIPMAELAPTAAPDRLLKVVRSGQGQPDFAYASLVAADGRVLAEVAAPGVVVPPWSPSRSPAGWLEDERLREDGHPSPLREFTAPVLEAGEYVGEVRLGYATPSLRELFAASSMPGLLALFVFLLAPLSWLLLRRELRALARLGRELECSPDGGAADFELEASGEVGEFLGSMNRFLEAKASRLEELEDRQTGLLASSRVISYQKQRLETVLEPLPDATLILDEDGQVDFANAKLAPVVGMPVESVRGERVADWCPYAEMTAFLTRFTGSGGRARSETLELRPDAESDRTLLLSAHPLPTPGGGGGSFGTLVVVRDVTAETVARRAQAEFVTHVSHELKSPLHTMAMYTEMLTDKDGESEEFRIEACNVISDEIERLTALISTLLTIARMEAGSVSLNRQRTRLQDFLRDALEAVSRGGRSAGLRFDLELPKELQPLYLDKDLLRVALNNLLTNAIKYNQEGGSVTLEVADELEKIELRVRDTGIGIEEADRDQIFDKFFRSASQDAHARGGHGLGLALARQIVRLHGGEISVASERGVGSTFSIVLRKNSALIREPGG